MVKVFPAGTRERFVELMCAGLSLREAAVQVGLLGASTPTRWWRQSGGMGVSAGRNGGVSDRMLDADAPRGRALTGFERGQIQAGVRAGWSYRRIGAEIGRDASVVFREVKRNTSPDGQYYAPVAHLRAHQARRRPKPFKLRENPGLCARIEEWMDQGWSPRLISLMLAQDAAAGETGRVSHETIYRALYVQARGSLRRDLAQKLSTGRTARRSRSSPSRTGKAIYEKALKISQRPPEVADRAVPGHWEGDLIIGSDGRSAIGTLVERSSRFVILLHLPGDHSAETVAAAMLAQMRGLPGHLRRSITWDRGTELAAYDRIQLELQAPVYFADPHSPWQRGSNENTNRLLRFWFTKGSDLSVWSAADIKRVQDTLNRRPRPTLELKTPAQALNELLQEAA